MNTTIEAQKVVIRCYLDEVVDERKAGLIDKLFTHDCIINRPENAEPITGNDRFKEALRRILATHSEIKTTLHEMICEGNRVAVRLSYRVVDRGDWTSRIGARAIAGKAVHSDAMASFQFRDGMIAEEFVNRDELGILIPSGVRLGGEPRTGVVRMPLLRTTRGRPE